MASVDDSLDNLGWLSCLVRHKLHAQQCMVQQIQPRLIELLWTLLQKVLRRETMRGIFDGSIFFERARALEKKNNTLGQKKRKAKKTA